MRPCEGNADDGDGEDEREQQVNERKPPSRQDQPHQIADRAQDTRADVATAILVFTRYRLEPEWEQRVDADVEGGLGPGNADDGNGHDYNGNTPPDGGPEASEHQPEH